MPLKHRVIPSRRRPLLLAMAMVLAMIINLTACAVNDSAATTATGTAGTTATIKPTGTTGTTAASDTAPTGPTKSA